MLAAKAAKAPPKAAAPNRTNKATHPALATQGRAHGHSEQQADPTQQAMPGVAWNFSKIHLFPPDRTDRPRASFPLAARPLPPRLQTKLIVGQVDDPLEHEADRIAGQVMRNPDPAPTTLQGDPGMLQRQCEACEQEDEERAVMRVPDPASASLHFNAGMLQRQCEACEKEEEKLTRKQAGGASGHGGMPAPDLVHDTLASAGSPLDAATRAFFEPRFQRDFSQVRLHADSRAAASAKAVGALGYTVGNHIVLAEGHAGSRALLAHELVHVVQQSGAPPVLRRFAPCRHLLDAKEKQPVAETDVQQSLASQAATLGTVERELGLPGGSAAPFRTEPGGRGKGDVIKPQTIGEDISGRVDLAVLTGTALELIEVKRATWADATFAESQLLNYVSKGNRAIGDVERIWRGRGHPNDNVASVRAMRMSRLNPETPQRIGGALVSLAWCRDGVVSFKSIGDQDKDVFVCGVDDQGRIDAFLDRAMDPAQKATEGYIAQAIEGRATKALEGMSLRAMLQKMLKIPQLRRLLPVTGIPGGDDMLLDMAVKQLEPFEAEIRAVALSFLHRVIAELRQQVQAQIRKLLQDAMAALCVKTAEMSMRELRDAFEKRMREFTVTLIPVVAEMVAGQMIKEALVAAAEAVAMAVGIVIGLIAAWEVAAFLAALEGIGTLIAGIGAAIARLIAMLAPLIPAFT
jgi:hypothetical protein